MPADTSSSDLLGHWTISFAARPFVWPFLRGAVVRIQPDGRPERLIVRVCTAGGAQLRAYVAICPARDRLRVHSVESNDGTLDLTVMASHADDGRPGLLASWSAPIAAARIWTGIEGGWIARPLADVSATPPRGSLATHGPRGERRELTSCSGRS